MAIWKNDKMGGYHKHGPKAHYVMRLGGAQKWLRIKDSGIL